MKTSSPTDPNGAREVPDAVVEPAFPFPEMDRRQLATTQQAILNALPANIALINSAGVILTVNESWQQFAGGNALPASVSGIGQNYLEICEGVTDENAGEARQVAAGIRSVLSGQSASFSLEYPCHSPAEDHWFRLIVSPLAEGHREGAVVMHIDITERKRAEETLRSSEERFSNAFEFAAIGMALVDLDGRWLKVNRALCELVGYSEANLLRLTFQDITHPDDLEADLENVRRLVAGEIRSYQMEKRYFHHSGRIVSVLLSVSLVRHARGEPLYFVSQIKDITERKRVELEVSRTNRSLVMLSTCNETLIRAERERDLLEEVCRLVVEIGGYRMAWVGYAHEDEGRTIQPVAVAGEDAGYLEQSRFTWSERDPSGHGPAGCTIRSGLPSICEDTSRDPSFALWRGPALARGYRGVIALPLREKDRTFGFLALYTSDAIQIRADEINLLQRLADNLAFGITNLRSREQRARIETAVLKIASGVSASAGLEFFAQLARNLAQALGAHAAVVDRVLPGEPLTSRTLAVVVDDEVRENFDYAVHGTPCEGLITQSSWQMKAHVGERFPGSAVAQMGAQGYVGRRLENSGGELLGGMFVLFREPLQETEFIASTLQIFAARAAAELERQSTDDHVREQAALLNAASDAIILRDLDQRILFWNRGAEHLYEWTAEEALGRNFRDIVAVDPEGFDARVEQLRRHGHWYGEAPARTKTGRDLTLEVRWTLVRDQTGKPKSILAINTDITERKRLAAQFLRVQRMESIGTLAGGIAHDLNNVLSPILMAIDLLEEKATDAATRSLLATLKTSSQHGADLVRQVLSFARGVEGQRVTVNLGHLVRDIRKIVHDTFPKNIAFDLEIERELWTVPGDPTQLHQVLMNLCVNARDAMPDGGTLTVQMKNTVLDDVFADLIPEAKPGAHVMVKVTDTGVGIPQAIRDKIFEPFFTTKELGKGTGLGLSTTQAIVRSHGGFINLYSESGRGSQFKVYLPANAAGPKDESQAAARARLPEGRGELILLIDDEEGIRDVAERILDRFGYRVLLARNGAEAVALYVQRQAEIALVVTDMAMPIMDGPATITALKAVSPHVRIVASSGLASKGGIAKASAAGVEHFVHKPYTAETLLTTLAKILRPDLPK